MPIVSEAIVAEVIKLQPEVQAPVEVASDPVKIASVAGAIELVGKLFAIKPDPEASKKLHRSVGKEVSENGQEIEETIINPVQSKTIVALSRGEKRVVRPASPVETASRRTEIATPNIVTPLDGIVLLLDDKKRLGATLAKNDPRRKRCINKHGWNVVFCIEPAFWPKELAPFFDVQSVFYRGNQAIVRYVDGRVDQYHTLFSSHKFESVVAYFRERYGEPTETPEIWSALIGKPKRLNPTRRWISKDSGAGEDTILEIRQTDDLRWSSPPDMENGMVRLFRRGAQSVFELLTSTDVMLANINHWNASSPSFASVKPVVPVGSKDDRLLAIGAIGASSILAKSLGGSTSAGSGASGGQGR
jgi:hypothetical protein